MTNKELPYTPKGDRCDVCGHRAEYLLTTQVRGAQQDWQVLPTVYPVRALCLWHFGCTAEHIEEMKERTKQRGTFWKEDGGTH
jgi:hypothetical protein